MKLLNKITFGLVALAAMAFSSCSNDLPEFNDSDAFVALRSSSVSFAENSEGTEIDVLLTSLNGIEGSVDFEIVPDSLAPAVEGKHYTILNDSKTLKFTKAAPTQTIKIKAIDNDTYGGDVRFTINLVNAQGVKLGADKTVSVTIEDDEHPLAFMLGTFNAKGNSYFNGESEWQIRITKDDSDVSKVWIYNFVLGGSSSSSPIYGTVSDAKDEIRIPVKQTLAVSSSYPHIWLEAYKGEEGEEDVNDFIVGVITTDDDGDAIISFPDYWFGSLVYTDDAATSTAGWYNLFTNGVVLKKSK
ncbi:MAG: hypothetical protein PUD51_08915 [Prevotellaceae bacterium]|nr:hypothetical protein [Prevotellaceae bacterium]